MYVLELRHGWCVDLRDRRLLQTGALLVLRVGRGGDGVGLVERRGHRLGRREPRRRLSIDHRLRGRCSGRRLGLELASRVG